MAHNYRGLETLYRNCFSADELVMKQRLWKTLCSDFFQQFVMPTDQIVDIGAGYCEFINNIIATGKIAVDLNPDTTKYAGSDVRVINEPADDIKGIPNNSVDVAFMSNFLEHLPSKQAILAVFREVHRMLRDNGRIIVLQPNIRYLPGEYWDFFDHHTPLTDRSLVEGLHLAGFSPAMVVPKFLPYTTKSRLPKNPIFLKTYLRIPPLWRLFGKQSLVVATKKQSL